jgi:hypothetical protein
MARRGWTRSVLVAVLAGAASGAGQLGLGYGLGIITWAPVSAGDPASNGAWSASLAWTVWVAATSVVLGAIIGNGFAASLVTGRFIRATWRVVMALAAAIGALVVVPLVAIPARAAQLGDNYAPQFVAGIYAAIGVVLGLVVALLALPARTIVTNVVGSAVWLWVLAVIAVIDGLASSRDLGFAPLAVWKFTEGGPVWHSFYVPGALLMVGAAVLIGGLSAFPGPGRGDNRVGVAISGAFGPLLVAVAYVLAAPGPGKAPTELVSAALTAPYAVIAGLAGSVLVAVVGSVPSRKSVPPVPAPRPRPAPSYPDLSYPDLSYPDLGTNPHGTGVASGTAAVPASARVTPSDFLTPPSRTDT